MTRVNALSFTPTLQLGDLNGLDLGSNIFKECARGANNKVMKSWESVQSCESLVEPCARLKVTTNLVYALFFQSHLPMFCDDGVDVY